MNKKFTQSVPAFYINFFVKPVLVLAVLFGAGDQLFAQTISQTFTSSGTFTVPSCVTSLQVQSWGGGGGGGGSISNPANNSGGGGGGGAYVMVPSVTVIPGNNYNVVVGAGGTAGSAVSGGNGGSSSFNGQVVAAGGAGGALYNNFLSSGNGAGGAGGTGGTYNGGNGHNGDHPDGGGGGGGGAGSAGNGGIGGAVVSSTGGTGGPGTQAGGVGGDGGTTDGLPGVAPGGGGGGANTQNLITGTSHSGGPGASGQVIVTYTLTSPTITSVTGPGCAGSTITINGTNLSSASSVTIGATAVTSLIISPTVITGTIAPGTTTGLVTVTTPCGSATSPSSFIVNTTPAPVNLGPQSICAGASYSFGGNIYTTAGTYYDTTASVLTGCDSITMVTLSVASAIQHSIAQSVCSGGSYSFAGHVYSAAGVYADTTTSTVSGCDSITTLTLSIAAVVPQTISQSICPGGSYNFNGTSYSAAGTYADTLAGAGVSGCDSIVVLTLSVNPYATGTVQDSICQGSTYTFNGIPYIAAGTYADTLTGASVNGCDSIITLILDIKSGSGSSVTVSANPTVICSGDSAEVCTTSGFVSYLWNNAATGTCIHTSLAGNYYVTATDVNGCTATSNHVSISAYPALSVSISVNGDTLTCYTPGAYQWYLNNVDIPNGTTGSIIAQVSGSYVVEVTDTNGCHVSSNAINVNVTGLNENDGLGMINVFPNPVSGGNWTIELAGDMPGSAYNVFDAEGRLVLKGYLKTNKDNIGGDLVPGVYVLQIHTGAANYTRRLVKL